MELHLNVQGFCWWERQSEVDRRNRDYLAYLNHSSFYSTSYCHLRKKKIIYRNLLRDRNVVSSSVSERARGAVWEQVVATSHTYCCLPYDRSDVGKP